MSFDCQFFFSTEKYEYIKNPFQICFQGAKDLFEALKYNDGNINTNIDDILDVYQIYVKWYNLSNSHEYSIKNNVEFLEFKYSVEHKDIYTNEPSYCIECNITVVNNDFRLSRLSLKFNILLNDKYH